MTQPFRLMSYNPQWSQEFEQTRSSILSATEGWLVGVQHIGSTALPGCVARPVVDLMAGIEDMQGLTTVCDLIEGLNFRRVETPQWCDDTLSALLVKPRHGEVTHSVLVVKHDATHWQRALDIRNYLLGDSAVLRKFSEIKSVHYHGGCSAPQEMESAKAEFFKTLEAHIDTEDRS